MNTIAIQREKEEAHIRDTLRNAGVHAQLEELTKHDYSDKLIDILIELVSATHDPIMKLQVLKSLCGPYKKAYARVEGVLVSQYLECADSPKAPGMDSLLWGIGNCIEITTNSDSHFLPTYKSIVGNKSHGTSRQMIVLALSKFKKDDVEDLLLELLDDPQVSGHAVMALGRIKSAKSTPLLMEMKKSAQPWVRREAEKSIRAIERGK